MIIYIGADHRGFALKESLKTYLHDQGYEVSDLGNTIQDETDDYPDFAAEVAKKVSANPEESRGIVICGSGAGVDIVANKFKRVRSVLAASADQAFDARHDDDANVLSLAANFINESDARHIVQVFISTSFGKEERFVRRIEKITAYENQIG